MPTQHPAYSAHNTTHNTPAIEYHPIYNNGCFGFERAIAIDTNTRYGGARAWEPEPGDRAWGLNIYI